MNKKIDIDYCGGEIIAESTEFLIVMDADSSLVNLYFLKISTSIYTFHTKLYFIEWQKLIKILNYFNFLKINKKKILNPFIIEKLPSNQILFSKNRFVICVSKKYFDRFKRIIKKADKKIIKLKTA